MEPQTFYDPTDRGFEAKVKRELEPALAKAEPGRQTEYIKTLLSRAADKYFSRMGWMPRVGLVWPSFIMSAINWRYRYSGCLGIIDPPDC